ncbi:hypothetical protein [Roseinatronobacter sp.]|uniref:hypothetical protein n=1 Tax=Roseinatronobacter sp. TaxID=1945755 RepID=UPI0025D58089|nr:hypothetical protein [Roseibaca sp.]
MASGYEKEDCKTAPVSGRSSHLSGRMMARAIDWAILTSGYALFGTIVMTGTNFVIG